MGFLFNPQLTSLHSFSESHRKYNPNLLCLEKVINLSPYNDRSHITESGLQRIGLQISIYDASDIVYVNDGSFAWEAGLIEEDEILSVNGIPIDALGYFGIYALLGDITILEYQFLIRTPEGDVEDVIVMAH